MHPIGSTSSRTPRYGIDVGDAAAWLVPFVLIVYLALRNGGYDTISRGEVGIVVWFGVAVATLVGVLPAAASSRPARVLVGLLVGFAVWTAVSFAWTDSAERTAVELARVATYLGFFVLALGLVDTGRARRVLGAVAAALGLVVVLAALSRLQPSLFPEQDVSDFIRDIELESRLAYPLNYSSALAAFTAAALPLLLAGAAFSRSVWVRSLAIGSLPFAALTLWYTGSGLAIPMTAVALAAFIALTRDRLLVIATLVPAAAAGAVVIAAANGREALDRGLLTDEAASQGDEVLVITLLAAGAAALLQALLVARRSAWAPRLRPPSIPRRSRPAAAVAAIALVVVLAVAAGAPGKLADQWQEFRSAEGLDPNEGTRTEQVLDVSTRGRYEYWQSAINAFESEPLLGIGPGTYEFWWASDGSGEGAIFVREAHSLYLETLAELGIVGLLLIGGFGLVLVAGSVNAVRSAVEDRPGVAAAAAACWVFAAAAGLDWMWEVAAFPIAFLILAAVAVGSRGAGGERNDPSGGGRRRLVRAAPTAVLAAAAIVAIAMPVAGESLVEKSRAELDDGEPEAALEAARDAVSVQPYAATPRIQEALVLEQLGRRAEAVEAGRQAVERESTNWRTWIVLAGIEARAGLAAEAVESYRRANQLNPRLIQAAGS